MKKLIVVFALLFSPGVLMAQQDGTGISIMVIPYEDSGVDSDPNNSVNKLMNTHIMDQFTRKGFRVIPWESIAAETGADVNVTLTKTKVLELINIAQESGNPSLKSRAVVIYKINFDFIEEDFGTRASIELSGEVLDVQANRFISQFSSPIENKKFLGKDCAKSQSCKEAALRQKARDVAIVLAQQATKPLKRLTGGNGNSVSSGGNTDSSGGLVNVIDFRFENFCFDALLKLKHEIDTKWPKTERTGAMQGGDGLASFELVTKAPQEKMVRWTYKTIRTVIGIPRDEVDIIFQGNTIFVSLNGSTSCDEQADDLTDEYR